MISSTRDEQRDKEIRRYPDLRLGRIDRLDHTWGTATPLIGRGVVDIPHSVTNDKLHAICDIEIVTVDSM